jgi:hypothetical protein
MIMEKIEAFKTSDGSLFDDKLKAERHELFLKKDMIVEEFLDSDLNPYTGPQRVIARNTIINWELWKVKNAE